MILCFTEPLRLFPPDEALLAVSYLPSIDTSQPSRPLLPSHRSEPGARRISKKGSVVMTEGLVVLESLRAIARKAESSQLSPSVLACFRTPTDAELADVGEKVSRQVELLHETLERILTDILPSIEAEELIDVCDVAAMELAEVRFQLERLERNQATSWELGLAATEGLSRILRVLAALEGGLCRSLGAERQISESPDVGPAIRIRRAYTRLWRSIEETRPADSRELEQRLRTAVTAIAKLRGREIFGRVRAGDVKAMYEIQRRVHGWLLDGGSTQEGFELWSDVVTFTQLIWHINMRAELVEHDARLLPSLASLLADLDPSSRPLENDSDSELHDRLHSLVGRSPDLDEMLLGRASSEVTAGALLEVVCRIEADLSSRFFGFSNDQHQMRSTA